MCDFHSIVVRRDGAKAHVPSNSHSEAVANAGWLENDQMADLRGEPRFVEAEWNCGGQYPGAEKIVRGNKLNKKQRVVIDNHYQAVAKLLADPKAHAERMLFGDGIFAGEEYADIRWKVLVHPDCPENLLNRLVERSLWADGEPIKSLHPAIKKISGSIKIAKNANIECNLTEVAGVVTVEPGATFTAPALTEAARAVRVAHGATLNAPVLTKAGFVRVAQGATLNAPVLTKADAVRVAHGATLNAPVLTKAGYVTVEQGATLNAPALTEVAGVVTVAQGATLNAPALTKAGSVRVEQGATFTAPSLTKADAVIVEEGETLNAPALTKAGAVIVALGATLDAPALTEVAGYVIVEPGATLNAPVLDEVAGFVTVAQGATLNAPALTKWLKACS